MISIHYPQYVFFLYCAAELMTSFENCYTPSPKSVEVERVFDVKEWMTPFSTTLLKGATSRYFK